MTDEQRPVPVGPGERATPIAAPRNSLASMLARGMTAEQIRGQAPEAHRQMDRRMGIRSEEEAGLLAAAKLDAPFPKATAPKPTAPAKPYWQRGDEARDTKTGKRVTILAARVKVNEEGIPYHRVAAGGEVWRVKETRLKPLK